MWTAFSVKLRTLSVLACPFPASRVNGVGTGFESPTDKIPTNSSTCFGAGRYENRVSLHCVLLCNARHALGLEHTQHVIKFVQRAVVTFSKEIVSVKTAPTSLLSHCMQQRDRSSVFFAPASQREQETSFQMILSFGMFCGERATDTTQDNDRGPGCSTGDNKTHGCWWWRGSKHVVLLARFSDLIEHQSRSEQVSFLL